jgi:hypothetical protein
MKRTNGKYKKNKNYKNSQFLTSIDGRIKLKSELERSDQETFLDGNKQLSMQELFLNLKKCCMYK